MNWVLLKSNEARSLRFCLLRLISRWPALLLLLLKFTYIDDLHQECILLFLVIFCFRGSSSLILSPYNVHVKTESTRTLSNFDFQWTKIIYQNNLKLIAFFLTFFKGQSCNNSSVVTPKEISYGSPRKWMSNFTKLHMKFSEFYLRNHNSSEIRPLFSRTSIRYFLWCYYRRFITSLAVFEM